MYPAGASAEERHHIRLEHRASRLGGVYDRATGQIQFPDSFDISALPAGFFSSTPSYLYSDASNSDSEMADAALSGLAVDSGSLSEGLPPPLTRAQNAYNPRQSSASEDSEEELRQMFRELAVSPAPPTGPGWGQWLQDRRDGLPLPVRTRTVEVLPTYDDPDSVPAFDANEDRFPRHFNGTFRRVHGPPTHTDLGCLPRRVGPGVVFYPNDPPSRLSDEQRRTLGTPEQCTEHGLYLPGTSPDTGPHFQVLLFTFHTFLPFYFYRWLCNRMFRRFMSRTLWQIYLPPSLTCICCQEEYPLLDYEEAEWACATSHFSTCCLSLWLCGDACFHGVPDAMRRGSCGVCARSVKFLGPLVRRTAWIVDSDAPISWQERHSA
ncbi:unnamed protein product [Oikopleura dioica]|uniref:Uncharacterized protein n=1 Tax=Oikopleura dioica TaxID=34765 RepID=E4XUW5_OIKDI|nr:unnamed protein product [Oikopleura dioica]